MNKKEALQILNCSQLDDVQDAYELILFGFKSKFLQQIPPLKLIESNIKKINRVTDAYVILTDFKSDFIIEKNEINWKGTLKETLNDYQTVLTQLRLRITNSVNGYEVVDLLNELKNLQINLFLKLDFYGSNLNTDIEEFPVKLSDEIGTFAIQTELKEMGIQDTEISEYIRAQITKGNFDNFSTLTKAIINAKKQIKFNGIRR